MSISRRPAGRMGPSQPAARAISADRRGPVLRLPRTAREESITLSRHAKKSSKAPRHDPREEKLEKGRALLAEWGLHDFTLTAHTPASVALEKLEPLIGRDPIADIVIAEWMGRFAEPAVAGRLVAWEAAATGKDLRREIRRSLFKLEQKGVTADRTHEAKPAFSLGEAVSSEPKGYLGSVDGEGSRMAWLVRTDRGTMTGVFTVLNDRDGMTYVDAVTARRSALMQTIKDTIGASGPLVEVPWKYVHALMGAAFRKGTPRPANMKADYLLNRVEITHDEPAPVPPCPVVEEIPASETADPALLKESVELFREREFGTWVLSPEIARRHIEEYAKASNSGLVVSKEAATERVTGIMDDALEEFLGGESRALLIRRLEESAWILSVRGKRDAARRALAVSRALATPEEHPVKEISFLRAFVFRAFAPYLGPPRGEGEDEGRAGEPASGGEAENTGDAESPLIIRP